RGSGFALTHSVPPNTCVFGHRLAEAQPIGGTGKWSRRAAGKGVREIPRNILEQRIAEAWALVRKGDTFGIGRRFLKQNAVL
ncbi:hypothetical protein, partial [Paracoccus sulfuroxidans]